MDPLRVLFVEDSELDAELLAHELTAAGHPVGRTRRVWTRRDLAAALTLEPWDLVLCDYVLPDCAPAAGTGPDDPFDGLQALAQVRACDADLPVILVSGQAGEELAVAAMRAGAGDYLVKGKLERLGTAVARELRERRVREDRRRAEAALKESEEHLRQAQRMETVGRLAGGIAHDFNNILSVISGYANLLQMRAGRAGTSHRELVEIEKAVLKAASLVRQLLAFSRRQPVRRQYLDPAEVLRDALPVLSMLLGEDVQVETRVAPDLPRVHADRGQLEQVIINLAANARDAMPRGGVLRLELAATELDADHFRPGEQATPGAFVRLTVEDTGSGMDEAILARIFEPFFTTKGEGRAAGLGLATVYGMVRQAGGTIRVRSAPGAGTAFVIHLPACPSMEPSESPPPRGPLRSTSRGEQILLAEDDEDLRHLAKDLLVLEGYRVLEARDGEEALGFARSGLPIDLVLTDVVMPRRNGCELAEAVLALRPGVPVLFMSGYAPEALMPAGGWPSEAFLEKPFAPPALLAKVRAALDAPRVEKHL